MEHRCINAASPCPDCPFDRIMTMNIDDLRNHCHSLEATLDIELNHIQPRMQDEINELVEAMKRIQAEFEYSSHVRPPEISRILDETLKKYDRKWKQ